LSRLSLKVIFSNLNNTTQNVCDRFCKYYNVKCSSEFLDDVQVV